MYLVNHPDVQWKAWMVFIAFQLLNWIGCATVCFGNRLLPVINNIGSFVVVGGVLTSIIVLAVKPKQYSTNELVWSTFANNTGWTNNGLVFIMGMLNGGEMCPVLFKFRVCAHLICSLLYRYARLHDTFS
jgi:choline transport protein